MLNIGEHPFEMKCIIDNIHDSEDEEAIEKSSKFGLEDDDGEILAMSSFLCEAELKIDTKHEEKPMLQCKVKKDEQSR